MNLYDRTVQLLIESTQRPEKIASEVGVSQSWLIMIKRHGMKDPSIHKIIRLYEYLSGRKVEV